MEWYYAKDGGQQGPVSEADLRDLIAGGSLKATDLVWHEGMADWQPVSKVAALSTALAAPAAPAPAAPAPPPMMGGSSPYQAPATRQPYSPGMQGADVATYLWQSIVVTLLCCLPFGVVAIVYAAKVDGLKRAGDWQAAKAASDSARMWCWISFAVGLVANLAFFAFGFIGAAADSGSFSP